MLYQCVLEVLGMKFKYLFAVILLKGGLTPALESESEYDSRPLTIPDSGTGSLPWNQWSRFHDWYWLHR